MKTKLYENGIIEIMDNHVVIKKVDNVLELFCMNDCSAIIVKIPVAGANTFPGLPDTHTDAAAKPAIPLPYPFSQSV
jgi:hypothetical protein